MDLSDLSALMGADLTTAANADIWVALPDPAGAPLLGEARRLADALGCYVQAVVKDEALADQAIALGADRVTVVGGAFEDYLAGCHPEFAFFPADHGAAAARLAQRLRAGMITAARQLSVDESTRALVGSHPVYGGDYALDLEVLSPAKIATLDPRQLPSPVADPGRIGQVRRADPAPATLAKPPAPADLGPVNYEPQKWRPLSKARVIVAVGRGVKDAEGCALARKLAAQIGAELGGDRAARDLGWIDEDHEVGVTGQEVAPNLYLAVGILGDTYHNTAIAGARRVIAIHANPEAPIFNAADLAIVAEPKDLLTRLIDHLA